MLARSSLLRLAYGPYPQPLPQRGRVENSHEKRQKAQNENLFGTCLQVFMTMPLCDPLPLPVNGENGYVKTLTKIIEICHAFCVSLWLFPSPRLFG